MVSKRSTRSLMARRLAWAAVAVLSVLAWLEAAGPVRAQTPAPTSNEFILRAPASRIQNIAARHGLTVIRQLDGQDVFLVSRSAMPLAPLNGLNGLENDGLQGGPSAVDATLSRYVRTECRRRHPEAASGNSLNGSLVAIRTLSDRSASATLTRSRYVSQPATAAIHLSAQRPARRHRRDHRHGCRPESGARRVAGARVPSTKPWAASE